MRRYRIQYRTDRGLFDYFCECEHIIAVKALAESMFGSQVVTIIDIT